MSPFLFPVFSLSGDCHSLLKRRSIVLQTLNMNWSCALRWSTEWYGVRMCQFWWRPQRSPSFCFLFWICAITQWTSLGWPDGWQETCGPAAPPLQLAARETADVREATEANQPLVNLPADGRCVKEPSWDRLNLAARTEQSIWPIGEWPIILRYTFKREVDMMAHEPAASIFLYK